MASFHWNIESIVHNSMVMLNTILDHIARQAIAANSAMPVDFFLVMRNYRLSLWGYTRKYPAFDFSNEPQFLSLVAGASLGRVFF